MSNPPKRSFLNGNDFLFLLFILLAACAPKEDLSKRALLNKTPNYLLARIQTPTANLQWFSAKASTEVEQNGKENSFKSAFKLRRDSLLWVSLSPALGIEIVRARLSPDSVMFINKLDDNYFTGSISDLGKKVNTEVSFNQLQALLLGQALEFDPDEKYRSSVEGYRYVLTSRTKKKYVKASENKDDVVDSTLSYMPRVNDRRLERITERQEEKLIVRRYFISPETFLITEIEIVDLANEQVLEVHYSEHEEVAGILFPHKIELYAWDNTNSLKVSLALYKIKVDQPQSMPFRIPEKYERIF